MFMNRNRFSTDLNTFCIEVSGPVFAFPLLSPQTEHPDWSICTQKHIGDLLNIHLANSPANSSTLGLTSHFISFGRLHSNWSPTFCLFSTVYLPRNMLKCTHHDKVPAVEIHFKIVRCEGSLGGREIFFFCYPILKMFWSFVVVDKI